MLNGKKLTGLLGVLFFGLIMALGNPVDAAAKDYKLKFQSSDNSGNPNFVIQQEWAERVKKMTNGRITIEMLPVNAIVKHTETLDAISAGILDGHVTATSYFSGKDPAFGLLGNTVGFMKSCWLLMVFNLSVPQPLVSKLLYQKFHWTRLLI